MAKQKEPPYQTLPPPEELLPMLLAGDYQGINSYRPGRPAPEWRKPTKHYKTVSKAQRKAAAKSRKINRRK
jgi:hypothetical protein